MSAARAKFSVNVYAACVAAVCLLVFLRALTCDFINWDDPLYVTENPAIRLLDWQFIKESFSVSYLGWWMPLTWISFAIDYQIWGLNPFGYHLTNILLHAANAGIVVLIADMLFRQIFIREEYPERYYRIAAILSGLLWGIHPLRVESVVWITERKDVLNGFFALLSVLLYLTYVQRKNMGEKGSSLLWVYVCSLLSLLISLTAKPVSVVIPAMLLVLDWYPLSRLKAGNCAGCIKEKIPYAIISAGMVLVTLFLASGESILVSYNDFPLTSRVILAGNSIFEYLKMTLFPLDLVNLYLLPRIFPPSFYVGAVLSVSIMLACAVTWRRRPWYPSTMLCFILPLVPVLGFFQNGAQAHADRFTYLPGIAVSIAAAGFFVKLAAASNAISRKVVYSVVLAVVLNFVLLSIHLTGAWKNAETLWTRVIKIQPVGRAYYLRAEYLAHNNRYREAADDISVSIQMGKNAGYPGVFYLHALRGDALIKSKQYESAVNEFSEAIRLNPHGIFFYHRGIALKALGRQDEADNDFRLAGYEKGPLDWGNIPAN